MAEVMVNRRKRYADRGSIITLRWRRRIAVHGVIIAVANGNALATYDVDKISFPIAYQHGFVVVLDVVFGVRMGRDIDWRSSWSWRWSIHQARGAASGSKSFIVGKVGLMWL
jgi:hypothetical protein